MSHIFEYREVSGGIEITRYNGEEEKVKLPEQLQGKQVVSVGKYCFRNNRKLIELIIPDSVTGIDSHACYDCRNLNKITISDHVTSIADGAFKNCGNISLVTLNIFQNKMTCLKSILSELSQKLYIELNYNPGMQKQQTAKVIFPKYAFDYVDNVEARIINQVTYGSGVHYRECMKEKDVDYRKYDHTFQIAKVNDTMETLFEIIENRLKYPYELSEDARNAYTEYLGDNLEQIAEFLLQEDDVDGILFLGDFGVLTRENIEPMLELAHEKKKTECVGVLLEYKNKHFKAAKKEFVL